MAGALPTFVIIGAQKCGTTALHAYLSRHPEISMSRPKELDYFIEEFNLAKGEDWYRSRFDPEFAVRGESSPNYTAYPKLERVPERMAALVPDAKLIFMVRDPVARVRAGYYHRYSNRAESRPMREAVLAPGESYVCRSRYHLQLTRFLDHYPLEQILLLEQEELLNDRRATLQRVYGFLGVNPNVWRKAFHEERLESAARGRRTRVGVFAAKRMPPKMWRKVKRRRPFASPYKQAPMDDALRAELEDLLREDAAKFRELTGRKFESWSV
jgi:hypothetical protein